MANEEADKQAQRNIEVESRLTAVEASQATKADLQGLGSELRTVIGEIRVDLQRELGDIRAELHKMDASIKTWMLATVLSILGTLLAALFGFNQISKNAAPVAAQPPLIINLPGVSLPPATTPR